MLHFAHHAVAGRPLSSLIRQCPSCTGFDTPIGPATGTGVVRASAKVSSSWMAEPGWAYLFPRTARTATNGPLTRTRCSLGRSSGTTARHHIWLNQCAASRPGVLLERNSHMHGMSQRTYLGNLLRPIYLGMASGMFCRSRMQHGPST